MDGEFSQLQTRRISVIDPIGQAIDWARDVLFRPFDLGKWFVLGFCAWLSMLGQHGGRGGGSSKWHGSGSRHDIERGLYEAWDWVLAHLVPILVIGSIVIVVLIVLWLLLLWLSSRGKFIFLDGVVRNRARVVEPWHRFRAIANSLFGLRIILDLIAFVFVFSILGFMGLSVWLHLDVDRAEPLLVLSIIFGVLGLLLTAFVFGLVKLVIEDFLVPLMYLRGCRVGPAWRELRGLLGARPGIFVLFVLVRIVIALVLAVIWILACCMTCCLVILPYIGTVILLPLWVFRRAYPLYLLGQFGPRYARFASLGPEAGPAPDVSPVEPETE